MQTLTGFLLGISVSAVVGLGIIVAAPHTDAPALPVVVAEFLEMQSGHVFCYTISNMERKCLSANKSKISKRK